MSYINNDNFSKAVRIIYNQSARFHYFGKPYNLGLAYHYIFGQWQDNSSFKIDQTKLTFTLYDHFPVAFTQQNIMIHVPLFKRVRDKF